MTGLPATQKAKVNSNKKEYGQWSLDALAEHVVNQHHTYARKMTPLIRQYAETVVQVHSEHHPETRTIAQLFEKLTGEMAMHMQREELLLFPYIRRLLRAQEEGTQLSVPPFGSAQDLIHKMDQEHDATGDLLAQIEELANGYVPPEGACGTFRALYANLKDFDTDTKKHIHVENDFLFPRIVQLEEELRHLQGGNLK